MAADLESVLGWLYPSFVLRQLPDGAGPHSLLGRGRLKAGQRSGTRLGRFHLSIAGRCIRHQGIEQLSRYLGYLVDGPAKCHLISFRRPGKATQFSNELERGCADFLACSWRRKVMQGSDVSTHKIFFVVE